MRSAREYIDSLRDGREVWYAGERVRNVADHPILRRIVENRAKEYDLHDDPAYADLLSFFSDSGERRCILYQIPKHKEDLLTRRKALELAFRKAGGSASDHLHFSIEGSIAHLLRIIDLVRGSWRDLMPKFRKNIEDFYDHCARNHRIISSAVLEAMGDKRKKAWEQPHFMRIVDENDEGLIVRGVRRVCTNAVQGHEMFVATSPDVYQRRDVSSQADELKPYLFMFALPVNTRGVKIICRPAAVSFREHTAVPFDFHRFDFPASWYDPMDALIAFDNVLVPWERVFSYQDIDFLRAFGPQSALAQYSEAIGAVATLELLTGSAYLMAEQRGDLDNPLTQSMLCELIVPLETLRAFIHAAESAAEVTVSGMVEPNRAVMDVAFLYLDNHYWNLLKLVRDLGGGSVTTNQTYADLIHPEIGEYVEECFGGKASGLRQLALLNLNQDLTSSRFAVRRESLMTFSLGPPTARKTGLLQAYDFKPLVERVSELIHTS
jgi:aromatic ring hydroxylase